MFDALWLRFEAPLMSFGGPLIDNLGRTQDLPGQSMITGVLANALGYEHADFEELSRLQARIRYAVRMDRRGERLTDFQTVDLGQDFLVDTGWTTRGRKEGREGASGKSTHIRQRDYLADASYTIALRLLPEDEEPSLSALEAALERPERPLFLGRKSCLPSRPLLLGRTQAASLLEALKKAPVSHRRGQGGEMQAWWPADELAGGSLLPVVDERDWVNQIHVGRRLLRHGVITLEEAVHVG